MNKKQIILTVGISNSGKTTWAEKYVKEKTGVININRDDIREFLFNNLSKYRITKTKESLVTRVQETMVEFAKQDKKDIIISDTNLNPKVRDKWEKWAKENNYQFVLKPFEVEPSVAKVRNIKRNYSIPPHVIDEQYVAFRKFMWLPTEYVEQECLPQGIVVDIDGTVAKMVSRTPFEFDKVLTDEPKSEIIDLVTMYKEKGYEIVFLSGRDSVCREDTLKWLLGHFDFHDFFLYMRDEKDDRTDAIVKEELFNKYIRGTFKVHLVLDDRDQVVQRWRSMGLTCLQVANGAF